MHKSQINQTLDNSIAQLPLSELRRKWAEYWGIQPHRYIRREMLEKSLTFKLRQLAGDGLTAEQQQRLDNLVAQYKHDPQCFDRKQVAMKPGTRLVRVWKGQRHDIFVRAGGFEYNGKVYTSLSQIASDITGTRWNGWVFFGLKKNKEVS